MGTSYDQGMDVVGMTEVIRELHASRTDVHVGPGPAWEWLRRGLDALTTYPSDAAMPDSRAASMIWGVPVILDPDVPGDEIRVGSVRYVVSDGQAARITTASP